MQVKMAGGNERPEGAASSAKVPSSAVKAGPSGQQKQVDPHGARRAAHQNAIERIAATCNAAEGLQDSTLLVVRNLSRVLEAN